MKSGSNSSPSLTFSLLLTLLIHLLCVKGEEEVELGFPMSPLCDRSKHLEFAKSQRGFIEFVVQPLFKEVEEVDPSGLVGQVGQ